MKLLKKINNYIYLYCKFITEKLSIYEVNHFIKN